MDIDKNMKKSQRVFVVLFFVVLFSACSNVTVIENEKIYEYNNKMFEDSEPTETLKFDFSDFDEVYITWEQDWEEETVYKYIVTKKDEAALFGALVELFEGEYHYVEPGDGIIGGMVCTVECYADGERIYNLNLRSSGFDLSESDYPGDVYEHSTNKRLLEGFLKIMKPYAAADNFHREKINY